MVFAIAALFFQFAPSVQAVPIAAASAAKTSIAEPATLAANLPESPNVEAVASKAKAMASESAPEPSSDSNSSSSGESSGVRASYSGTPGHNMEALSAIRIPESISAKPSALLGVERFPSRRNWIALSLVQHGAAAFDAYTTRDAMSRGGVEADPLMRPFASSPAMYAAIQVLPVALDYTARRMQRSPNNFIRRMWWVPQSVNTASFIFSGVHNLHVAGAR